jgi:hypothetical protein
VLVDQFLAVKPVWQKYQAEIGADVIEAAQNANQAR